MRSKLLVVSVVSVLIAVASPDASVEAQTVTTTASPSATVVPTKTPVSNIVEKEIQNLKEKIATKVAELRKKNLKAVSGTVLDVKGSTMRIKTIDEEEYIVETDDTLTKAFLVSGASKKDQKLTDIKSGAYVIVTGPTVDKTISANYIYQDEQFMVSTGKITEVNATDNVLKVLTSDKDNLTLEVLTPPTRLQILDSKTFEVSTIRFSQFKEGDTVHFVVKKTGEEKDNTYTPQKVLLIPQEFFIK